MSDLILQVDHLHKTYLLDQVKLHVLRGVKLEVRRGEFLAVVGASGSGKSTLLHLMGLLDVADSGSLVIDGVDATKLNSARRASLRRTDIGFVFQFYHLLPELNVVENVQIAQMTAAGVLGWPGRRRSARRHAVELLEAMGLGQRLKHRPRELSGGERQRVAIARALVNNPKVVLADEPTGNLDSKTGGAILAVLRRLNQQAHQTLVMVTHDITLAQQADRIVHLKDGRLCEGQEAVKQ